MKETILNSLDVDAHAPIPDFSKTTVLMSSGAVPSLNFNEFRA
jgi:hypothetical protein